MAHFNYTNGCKSFIVELWLYNAFSFKDNKVLIVLFTDETWLRWVMCGETMQYDNLHSGIDAMLYGRCSRYRKINFFRYL